MTKVLRLAPALVALLAVVAVQGWYLAFVLKAGTPAHDAVTASLRELPGLVLVLLPTWLSCVIPRRMSRLLRVVTLVCGALSLGIGVSIALFVALRPGEVAFLAVAAVYVLAGLLQLIYLESLRSPLNQSTTGSR